MLTITIGCPGSGKSTWAEENLPGSTLRLERDRYRECLFGSRRNYHSHPFDPSLKSEAITQSMLAAMIYWPTPDWAVTDTGLQEKSVKPFIDHAQRCDEAIELIIFNRPLDLLLERNRNRIPEHQVPEDILVDFHDKFFLPDDVWWKQSMYQRTFV